MEEAGIEMYLQGYGYAMQRISQKLFEAARCPQPISELNKKAYIHIIEGWRKRALRVANTHVLM